MAGDFGDYFIERARAMEYETDEIVKATTTEVFCIHSTDCEGKTRGPCVALAYDRSAADLIIEARPDKMGIIKETEALVILKGDGTEDVWLLARPTPVTAAEVQSDEDDAREVLFKRAEEKLTPAERLAYSGHQETVDDEDAPAQEDAKDV